MSTSATSAICGWEGGTNSGISETYFRHSFASDPMSEQEALPIFHRVSQLEYPNHDSPIIEVETIKSRDQQSSKFPNKFCLLTFEMAPSVVNEEKNKTQYDHTFTEAVIAATGPKANPRLREVITALIRHVHDFAREVNLTTDEYMAGVALMNWAGQMSTDKRNEGQLVTDVIGLES